jgi:hypothetical protein
MYSPKRYMTKQVVTDVLAEFEWPSPYTVDDEGLPDDITVAFPGCLLVFNEGFESDMSMAFELPVSDKLIDLGAAMRSLRDGIEVPETPGLSGHFSPGATLEKVQHGLRDICRRVLAHFRKTLEGDYGWVPRFEECEREGRARVRREQAAGLSVERLLDDLRRNGASVDVRLRAAEELARRGLVDAASVIEEAASEERNASIREQLQGALRKLRSRDAR